MTLDDRHKKNGKVEIKAMAPERASMRMLPYMEQGVIIGVIRFLAPVGLNKRIVTWRLRFIIRRSVWHTDLPIGVL